MNMRRWLLLVLIVAVAAGATAQMTQAQADALQRAVARIANVDFSVENVIFDGMTVDDVEDVLGEPVQIEHTAVFVEGRFMHASSHGTWVVLWNNAFRSNRPVVVGFLRRGETRVRHNYVDQVR
jgi:hypothetical protein